MDRSSIYIGRDLSFSNGMTFKNLKIGEIIDIGFSDYMNFINLFCVTNFDMMVPLWDSGVDYDFVKNYELFLNMYSGSKEYYDKYFDRLMSLKDGRILSVDGEARVCFKMNGSRVFIDIDTYDEISKWLKIMHNYTNREDPLTISKGNGLKSFIVEIEREELENRKDNSKDFKDLLSAISWGNSSGINCLNVHDLNIYQFYEGLARINKIEEYKNTMSGIYGGTIDKKKVRFEKIDWTSKIGK